MMNRRIFTLLVGAVVAGMPMCRAHAEGLPPDGGGDDPSTCVVSDYGTKSCTEPAPYEPTPCELAMNEIWAASQIEIDALLLLPICADFGKGFEDGIAESGTPDLSFDSPSGKMVLVNRKALRKLKRQAKRKTC